MNRLAATLLLALAGLVLTPSTAFAQDELPEWLQKEMAKETKRLKKSKVSLLDGRFTARQRGKLIDKPVDQEWGQYFLIDIGSEYPASCYFYEDFRTTASLIDAFTDAVIEEMEANNNATLRAKSVQSVAAGHVDRFPYLRAEWLTIVDTETQPLAGQVRVAAAPLGEFSLVCTHNELGYSDTFVRMFESLLESAKISDERWNPHFSELHVFRLGDRPVGFSLVSHTNDDEGDTEIVTSESTVLAIDANTLYTSDSYNTEWSRPDGSLINATTLDIESNEIAQNLAIQTGDTGAWVIGGTMQGKEIEGEIDGETTLLTSLGQSLAVRDTLADADTADFTMPVWLPVVNPLAVTDASFEQTGDRTGLLKIGPIEIAAEFAKTGSLEKGTVDFAGNEMSLELVWSEGTLGADE